jgi:UDPglucose 6-dehydrogenase
MWTLCSDKYAALQDVDALVICTEWQEFRMPDFANMAMHMRNKVIVGERNLYQPNKLQEKEWTYFSVGRTASSSTTTHRMFEPTR